MGQGSRNNNQSHSTAAAPSLQRAHEDNMKGFEWRLMGPIIYKRPVPSSQIGGSKPQLSSSVSVSKPVCPAK